eukprot:297728_1
MSKQVSNISRISTFLMIFAIACLIILHFKNNQKFNQSVITVSQPIIHSLHLTSTHIGSDPLLIPYRNETMTSIAWKKFYNGTGQLIVIHARKAGGTTVRHWMGTLMSRIKKYHRNKYNTTWNTTFKAHEFWTYYHHNNSNRINAIFKNNPFAIYLVAFRNPVQRIISQYDFEWRWGCQRCNVKSEMFDDKHKHETQNHKTFMKYYRIPEYKTEKRKKKLKQYYKHKLSNIELDEMLQRVDKYQNTNNSKVKYKISFNAYLHNYYLWMFCCTSIHCNIDRNFVQRNKINECIKNAMRMINTFDIVLVDEWMNDMRTQKYVNYLLLGAEFNAPNNTYVGMDTAFKRPKKRPISTQRGKNVMIPEEVFQKIYEMNKWDLKLFDYIKQVAFERERGVWKQFGAELELNISNNIN